MRFRRNGPPSTNGSRAEAPATLELRDVCASYGPYRALFDVSFTVPQGAVVALLGSNGAGKSTTARVVTGLIPCTAGQVVFDGAEISATSAWKVARRGVAHVPEGRGVLGTLTVEENLQLVFRQRAPKSDVPDLIEEAYRTFPVLAERRRQAAGTLSGGQQRILSLAKVLVLPQKLLVADELSLGLAPVIVDQVYECLERINKAGTALLVVEQQVDRVLAIANRAVVLDHGGVAFEGAPEEAKSAVERIVASRAERTGARQVDWSQAR